MKKQLLSLASALATVPIIMLGLAGTASAAPVTALHSPNLTSQAGATTPGSYSISTESGATLLQGQNNIGLSGDDNSSTISFPFSVQFYGSSYTSASVTTNGVVDFTGGSNVNAYANTSIPTSDFGPAILPNWEDLYIDGGNDGIFTATYGVAPNRVFVIEYRAEQCCSDTGNPTYDFEVVLSESSSTIRTLYQTTADDGQYATVGVQNGSSGPSTTYAYDQTNSVYPGLEVDYTYQPGVAPPSISALWPGFSPPPTSASTTTLPGQLVWTVSSAGAGGICQFVISDSVNGGPLTQIYSGLGTGNTKGKNYWFFQTFTVGDYYEYEVQPFDCQGDAGAPTYTYFDPSQYLENSSLFKYSGSWTRTHSSGALGGYDAVTTRKGSYLTFKTYSYNFGLIAAMGPSGGIADVYANGLKVGSVNLYSKTVRAAEYVFRDGYDGSYSNPVVKVTNASTSSTRNKIAFNGIYAQQ